jgi:phosphoribosylaminoimidazole-succinocarboxamide synthase
VLKVDRDLLLIDECLTLDSSRFWPKDEYVVGQSPPSFDKQFVRDYLETLNWDKNPARGCRRTLSRRLPRNILKHFVA